MKVSRLFIIAIAAALLSVPAIALAQEKIPAALESISVTIASDDERTGRLDFRNAELEFLHNNEERAKKDIPQNWQTGLQESIGNMSVFQDDAATKVNLSVKILKLEVTVAGFPDKTSTTEARYELTDRKTGDLIFTQNITSIGVAGVSYSLNGVACIRESANRAIQNNIAQFMPILKTVDVKQPMFQAAFLTDDVKKRAQADLEGLCLDAFLKEGKQGVNGYQPASSSILKEGVFAIGKFNSQQYCGWARKVGTWEDTDKRAIESCENVKPKGASNCDVYAHSNHIVYVPLHERIEAAQKLFETGDVTATEHALNEIKVRNPINLSQADRGEYEYLLGKVLANSGPKQNLPDAISHFNNSWHYSNVNGAVEEGNLWIAEGNIDQHWQSIRDAYQYFLAKASDEQKSQHPEVAKNLKKTERYYQADLAKQEKQARIDADDAKREAERQAKQDRLDAIKAEREEKRQEKIRLAEERRIAKEGDGSADDITCKGKGNRPSSRGYINCRSEIVRAKQVAEQQRIAAEKSAAAQKAAKVAANQKAAEDFKKSKKCADETRNPECMNLAGIAAYNLGNIDHAKSWFTLAARYGEPKAIANLTYKGWTVPEPDLLQQQQRQQQQKDNEPGFGTMLFLSILSGYNSSHGETSYAPLPGAGIAKVPSYGVTPTYQPKQGYQTRDANGAVVNSLSNYQTRDVNGAIVNSQDNYQTRDLSGAVVNSHDNFQTRDANGAVVNTGN